MTWHHQFYIQKKEEQDRKISKQYLRTDIAPIKIRKQTIVRHRIGKRYQFGQMHQERHQNRDGVQHQKKSLMDVKQLHSAKLMFFVRNLGSYIHTRPKIRIGLQNTCINFNGTIYVVYHLIDRNQFGRKRSIRHTIDFKCKMCIRL